MYVISIARKRDSSIPRILRQLWDRWRTNTCGTERNLRNSKWLWTSWKYPWLPFYSYRRSEPVWLAIQGQFSLFKLPPSNVKEIASWAICESSPFYPCQNKSINRTPDAPHLLHTRTDRSLSLRCSQARRLTDRLTECSWYHLRGKSSALTADNKFTQFIEFTTRYNFHRQTHHLHLMLSFLIYHLLPCTCIGGWSAVNLLFFSLLFNRF